MVSGDATYPLSNLIEISNCSYDMDLHFFQMAAAAIDLKKKQISAFDNVKNGKLVFLQNIDLIS